MQFPDWKDIPEPQSMLTLSWEDIYEQAEPDTQDKFHRNPTRQEIKEIFERVSRKGMDTENGTFWSAIEYHCHEYYAGVKN